MRDEVPYTLHHPRWYRRRVSVWWWLQRRAYAGFVLRELTSLFVALFAGVTLWELWTLVQGPEAYARFLARLETPPLLALHAVAFPFVLFHAVTWFHLAPKALAARVRGRRLPDGIIVGVNYGVGLVLSGVVAWILLAGRG
jgi:fumarate reductase subunit C